MSTTASSSKRKTPSAPADHQHHQQQQGTGATRNKDKHGEPLASPPGRSARGMMLRSGRKKRRRSRETSGLTPDQQEQQQQQDETQKLVNGNKRRRLDQEDETEASIEEDASMEQDAHEEELSEDEDEDDDEHMGDAMEQDHNDNAERNLPPTSVRATRTMVTAVEVSVSPMPPAATKPMNGHDGLDARPTTKATTTTTTTTRTRTATNSNQQVAPSGTRIGTRRLFLGSPGDSPGDEEEKKKEQQDEPHPPIVVTETVMEPPQVQRHTQDLRAILVDGSVLSEEEVDEQVHSQSTWPMRLSQSLSSSFLHVLSSIQDITTSLVAPRREKYERNDGEQNDEQVNQRLLQRTKKLASISSLAVWTRFDVWFILLLVLQMCLWSAITLPMLKAMGDSSSAFYKSLSSSSTKAQPTAVPLSVATPSNVVIDTGESLGTLRSSNLRLSALTRVRDDLSIQLSQMDRLLEEREQVILLWKNTLEDTEQSLMSLVSKLKSSHDNLDEDTIDAAIGLIDNLDEVSTGSMASSLVDLSSVSMPTRTGPLFAASCDAVNHASVDADALLAPESLMIQEMSFREMAASSVVKFVSDPSSTEDVRSWIREKIREVMKDSTVATDDKLVPHGGLSEEDVLEAIATRMELVRADLTGQFDYASVPSGAFVIRSGPRATSPSLVDKLPLLNRWLHCVRLRFYGHGPEAALMPTYPMESLGQCWAFNSNDNDHVSSLGSLATLSVRLAKPVRVDSVVVEHAPRGRTDQAQSAIREFRVFGYTDWDATDDPIPLGAFLYDIGSDHALQTFPIKSVAREIRAVTLAVDSNWGHPYSCLYRFRVQGTSG